MAAVFEPLFVPKESKVVDTEVSTIESIWGDAIGLDGHFETFGDLSDCKEAYRLQQSIYLDYMDGIIIKKLQNLIKVTKRDSPSNYIELWNFIKSLPIDMQNKLTGV